MRFAKFVGVLALLIAGCAHQPPPKTASKDGIDRWNAARAGVLYSLAKEQFEGGNLDVMLFPLGLILFVLLITAEWLVRKFSNLS